jgi:glycyl-tRNA synthetase
MNEIEREKLLKLFIAPTAEIYAGRALAGLLDWLPAGAHIKRKVCKSWIKFFVFNVPNTFLIDGSTIMPLAVFEASGHLLSFKDPTLKCPTCGNIYRVDKLKELTGGELVCPADGTDLSNQKVEERSLMMEVKVGFTAESFNAALRPETAQSIYVNYLNFKRLGLKTPFAICQVGRSYRNEISPRLSELRFREFTQMEIEEFVLPDQLDYHPLFDEVRSTSIRFCYDEKIEETTVEEALEKGFLPNVRYAFWIAKEWSWLVEELKFPKEKLRFRIVPPEERAFYSRFTIDTEVLLNGKWIEIIGTAWRGDYDLTLHSKHSGAPLREGGTVPHVIEPSFGLDRITLALIMLHYDFKPRDRRWPVLRIPYKFAPFDVGIAVVAHTKEYLNLVEKIDIFLRRNSFVTLNLAREGRISAQYAKADLLGIPHVVTVDSETPTTGTVTVRDRESKQQVRVKIENLIDILS